MLNIKCPYCGHEYETEVFELNPSELFEEEECPVCKKCYAFEFEYQPRLNRVKKLEEIQKEKVPPYSREDYLKAEALGLSLDNWNDYQEFYDLGVISND